MAVKQVIPFTLSFVQLNSMFVPTLTVPPGTFSLFTGRLEARSTHETLHSPPPQKKYITLLQ